jgi:glycosyltransferase involved in cell wall biosynthesis
VDSGYGVFVKERVRAVAGLNGHQMRVVAPTPYFPPIGLFPKWARWASFPREEAVDGIHVRRPRYVMAPKVGGYVQPQLMYPSTHRMARRLLADGFDFDLIDAHFVHPYGVLGAMLARKHDKPLVMTGRGEDILRFPGLPIIGRQVRRAVQRCDRFIALSKEIARAMEGQGAPADRIRVIPNGVDCDKFRPLPIAAAREELGLPTDRPIVVSIGNLQERKGFHLLVDAIPEIRRRFPEVLVVIVGGPAPYGSDFGPEIRARIEALGGGDHVRLVGARPHEELCRWYSAADVFTLLSSREGSPNVLMEALACGAPSVATRVGGIPEVLCDARLGLVIPERTAAAAAEGITQALDRFWDRQAIRRTIEASHSWRRRAVEIATVFDEIIR